MDADWESQPSHYDTEWMLDTTQLTLSLDILKLSPSADLFACRINKQGPTFVPLRPDPEAIAVDAFTIKWSNDIFYAFQPFSLIPTVLRKIMDDQAEETLVMPKWPTQAWYPKVMQMIKQPPVDPRPQKSLLQLPNNPDLFLIKCKNVQCISGHSLIDESSCLSVLSQSVMIFRNTLT